MSKIKIEGFDEVQEMLKEYKEGGALELKHYRAIGTVEECREARERQRAKKIIHNPDGGVDEDWLCPSCGRFCSPYHKFCINCGQKVEGDTD